MKDNRRDEIKIIIEKNGRMSLDELIERFPKVSHMTLRRDLLSLEELGEIIRVRGGAISVRELAKKTELQISERTSYKVVEKKEIAEKAVKLVDSGTMLYIDSGSTTLYFAKELPDKNYYILTSGLNIALELSRKSMPIITMIGGEVSRNNLATSGNASRDFLEKVNIETAIMSATAFTLEGGFSCGLQADAMLKIKILEKVRRRIMLLDTSKIGKTMPYTFSKAFDLDVLVVDSNFPKELKVLFESKGIVVI